jgi:hypothetical protein
VAGNGKNLGQESQLKLVWKLPISSKAEKMIRQMVIQNAAHAQGR